MSYYILICLALALTGVTGLQMAYLFYIDKLDKERKKRLRYLERRCRSLAARLDQAERRMQEQDMLIDSLYLEDH
jgi:hypothetical protein